MTNWFLALIHQAQEAIEFVAFCGLFGRKVQEHGFAICDGPHSFAQAHHRPAGLLSASSGLTVPPVDTYEHIDVHLGGGNIRMAQQNLQHTDARCVGKALCDLQNLGCLASMRELFLCVHEVAG